MVYNFECGRRLWEKQIHTTGTGDGEVKAIYQDEEAPSVP